MQTLATLLVASFVFFAAFSLVPGDPVRALFGFQPPPLEVYEAIREQFHLDEPLLVQYYYFMADLITGNFGRALRGATVVGILAETIPISAGILAASLVVQVVVGGALAIWAAQRKRAGTDLVTYAMALLLVSVPVIVSAYALQAFVGLEVRSLPHTWIVGAGWTNYILPVAALSASFAAYLLLLGRAELLATLRAPFMRTTRAFGIRTRRAVAVHAMRASLPPLIAFLTANLGNLIAGLVVVESIFNVPGVGLVIYEAIQLPDRSLLVVVMMLILALVIVATSLGDILSSMIDPRVRLEET